MVELAKKSKMNLIKLIKIYKEEIEDKLERQEIVTKEPFVESKRNSMGTRYDLNYMYGYKYAALWIEHDSYNLRSMIKAAKAGEMISQYREKFCPFSLSMMMMFDLLEPNKKPDAKMYKKNDLQRSRYALCMKYAYIHNIDPHLVSAFVASVGGHKAIVAKLKIDQNEHWLEKSVRKKQLKKLKKFSSK